MIIVCDLDGTLTDADGVISAANARSLRTAGERGATRVLATSRPSRCLDLPAEHLALFDCVITCDGAEQAAPGPVGVRVPLPPRAVLRAERALLDAGVAGAYAVEYGTGLGLGPGYLDWPATDTEVAARVGSLRELCELAPVARLYFCPRNRDAVVAANACLTATADDATTVTLVRTASLVRLHDRRATKGGAVQAWLAATGRPGRLVVFGDQRNDLSMLELADHPYVVGDADPDLRRRFTHLPNDDFAAVARAVDLLPVATDPGQNGWG